MARCPACNKNIDYLRMHGEGFITSNLSLRDNEVVEDNIKVSGEMLEEDYYCPLCDNYVCSSWSNAEGFLKEEWNPEEETE